MSNKNKKKVINQSIKEEIGNRLKKFAQSNYGGVTNLADAIGIYQTQISNYNKGYFLPSGEILYLLAEAGLSIDYLFFGDKKITDNSFVKVFNKYGINDPKKLDEILKLFSDLKTKLAETI